MAERISAFNWVATPLGPISSWPRCLKSAVDLMLASRFPMSIHWGRQGIFLYNDAEARILGRFHPAALGQPACEALPLNWHATEAVFNSVMSGESAVFSEKHWVVQENGGEREIWIDHLASPIRDEDGAIAGVWTVLVDATARIEAERQRKEAEDALQESEARQAFLLLFNDKLRDIADPLAVLSAATRMAGEHFGVSQCCYEEVSSHVVQLSGFWSLDPGATGCFTFAELAAALGSGFTGPAVVVDDIDEEPRLGEEARSRLRTAGIAAFVSARLQGEAAFTVQSVVPRLWTTSEVEQIREVGERAQLAARRAQAEVALRNSEARFRQFAEASTDVIWIRNARTLQLEYWNHGFELGFGDKWDHALGGCNLKDWLDIVVPEDRERALAAMAAARSGEHAACEYRLRRPRDGEIRWMRSNIFPLLDDAGGVQRVGSICHDTTDEKATAERMEIMVAELQHRTRNLMAVLQSIVAQTLAASGDLDSFKMRIDDRLAVLSRVQYLLSRSEQEPVTIGALVRLELDGISREAAPGRIEISGPDVRLRNSTVQMLALALHELASDARSHGALAADIGRLRIGWQLEQDGSAPCLRLSWIEERPVCVAARRDRSYGQELIERALPYSLNAETRYELDETGLRCTISLPLTREGSKERGA